MKLYADQELYEHAQTVKRSIFAMRSVLETHYDPAQYVQSDSFVESVYEEEMDELRRNLLPYYPSLSPIRKIECIDISNTQGTHATGSLVVLQDGRPDTKWYRRFKIRTKDAPNDFAMIAEVVRRRIKHTEWPYPDLLVIDGGKGQVRSALASLKEEGISLPVVGLAKRFEEIVIPKVIDFHVLRLPVSSKALHMLQRLRDESHRFALTYHRTLRKKAFIAKD
jgi:excinuclease ABC subunit C